MGATRNTGYLENLIAYDASNNVAIATTAIDNAFKITMGGSVKMTGALNGTSATFSSSVTATQINIKDSTTDNPSTLALFEGAQTNRGLQIGLTTDSLGAVGSAVIYNARVGGGYGGHIWQNGGSTKMILNASGNVGIGTTSPSYGIELKKTGTDSTVWGYNIAQFADAQTNNNGLRIGTSTTTSGLTNLIAATANDASQLAFWTYNGTSWGERMRITSGALS